MPDPAREAAEMRVVIRMADQAVPPGPEPGHAAAALRSQAEVTQAGLRAFLRAHGGRRLTPLPIINGVSAFIPHGLLPAVSRFPGVDRVVADPGWRFPAATPAGTGSPGWNLQSVHADALWARGFRGQGVVAANMDTGVDVRHVDVADRWRGGDNSWFDPFTDSVEPYDPIGHGTQTLGIMLGGSGFGVAPGAQWIAARIYDDSGHSSLTVVHQAFFWLLDPDGDPATPDAPRVVNASWAIGDSVGCDLEFMPDVQRLTSAGILVVFPAGNAGPREGSGGSPADNPGSFAVAAVDRDGRVASFSSRGPSACHDGVFPHVAAPGMDIVTLDVSLPGIPQYAVVAGSSFAAPHVAGAAALLLSAFPSLSPAQLRWALTAGARDGDAPGPDARVGHGILDVAASHVALQRAVARGYLLHPPTD
ncbi:MAG: S8 family serine peptidase [Deltaproteobacteria bacterium]|nr:S8 family serine peptidase [Deltaproteobacteria bacterium]